MSVLIVGQSHVAAIRAAHAARRAGNIRCERTRAIHTLEQRFLPEIAGWDEGEPHFNEVLKAEIAEEIARFGPRLASMIGGNAHNVLALIRHPRPFDFRLSGEEQGPPIDEEAEPISEALVRVALEDKLGLDMLRLRLLRALIGPFVHIESPPPLRDEELIRARADAWFRENGVEALGIAPAGLRWRMWRLNSRVFREAAERLGCGFMPVPAAVQDADGFLRAELAGDATHGNAEYGELVLRAIEALPESG